jgi:hypothetical protein
MLTPTLDPDAPPICMPAKRMSIKFVVPEESVVLSPSSVSIAIVVSAASLGLVCTGLVCVWLWWWKDDPAIRVTKPTNSAGALLGSLFLYSSVVWLAYWPETTGDSMPCVLYTHSSQLGITLILSSFTAKNWRIWWMLSKTESTRARISISSFVPPSDLSVFGVFCVLVLGDVAILAAWQVLSPIAMQMVEGESYIVATDNLSPLRLNESTLYCHTDSQTAWLLLTLCWKLLPCGICAYTTFGIRHVNLPLNEGGRIMGTVAATVVLGVGLVVFSSDHPGPTLRLVEVGLLTVCYTFIVQFLLFGSLISQTLCKKESQIPTLRNSSAASQPSRMSSSLPGPSRSYLQSRQISRSGHKAPSPCQKNRPLVLPVTPEATDTQPQQAVVESRDVAMRTGLVCCVEQAQSVVTLNIARVSLTHHSALVLAQKSPDQENTTPL